MDTVLSVKEQGRTRSKIPSKKFALFVACAAIFMMFAAFTSAYVVRQAAGNWLEFQLPNVFWYNTIVLFASSVTLHLAYINFKQERTIFYRSFLVVTFLLGIAFVALQYQGYLAMNDIGVYLDGNPSGAFVMVISGVHAAHVIGGIATLIVALIHALVLKHRVTPARKLRFEMTLTYWHFMDFLWIYLILFFTLQ